MVAWFSNGASISHMKRSLLLTQDPTSHISRLLTQLRREIERLSVRIVAIERYQRQFIASDVHGEEDEENAAEDIVVNLEALHSDMVTYRQQLEDQLAHITHGYTTLQTMELNAVTQTCAAYIYNDVRLLVRDVAVAREGYNELIENIIETIEHSDT